MHKRNQIILWIAIIVSVIAYSFWDLIKKNTGIGIFYYGNALAFFILSLFIWINHKKYSTSFVLLCIASNNLLDEIFFDNTKIGLNEYLFLAIVILITYLRYARKTTKYIKRAYRFFH